MDYLQYENYLAHYGVVGMKWGVRRYQNYDGTLTTAGKRRMYKDAKKAAKNGDSYTFNRKYSTELIKFSDTSKDVVKKRIDNPDMYPDQDAFYNNLKTVSKGDARALIGKYADKKINDVYTDNNKTVEDFIAQQLRRIGTESANLEYEYQKELERIHAERNKRADQTFATFTKAEQDQALSLSKSLSRNNYGDYVLSTKTKIGKDNVMVETRSKSGLEKADAIDTVNFLKKFDGEKAKEGIAKDYYDGPNSWIDKDPSGDNYHTRDDFKNKMYLTNIELDPEWRTYVAWYEDGGTYGYHAFCVEGSMDDMKARYRSLEG